MSFAHRSKRLPAQQWTTPQALASLIGCAPRTITAWIRRGVLPGHAGEFRHYSDERVRLSARRMYRIHEADVLRFLEQLRGGKVSTRGLWRGKNSL